MKYHITHTHEANWPHSVASALPATPQPRIMTNRKLKMVQNTAPITMVTSARVGAPAVRMKLLTPAPMTWKMKPAPRIWMNRREYSQSSAVAPEIASTASINGGICVKTNTMTASTMPSVMVLPKQRCAAPRSPWPMRNAASALPPLPTSIASAMNSVMRGIAVVAVERPISPTAWPRKMESMTL